MSSIKVNYSLNKKYFVDQYVFQKLISIAAKKSIFSKLVDSNISLAKEKDTFRAKIKILTKKGSSYKESILELKELIETYIENIIEITPENITISIEGEF